MSQTRDKPYRLIGANPSPYSVKMRAIMRYRRLPFTWELRNAENTKETAHVRPPVMPYLQYPDGTFHNDTTPMIFDLESRHRLHQKNNYIHYKRISSDVSFLSYDIWGVTCFCGLVIEA